MNLTEFKAFIEGLEHAFRGEAPNAEQWQLIKDKLHQVGEQEKTGKTLRDLGWEAAEEKRKADSDRIPWPRMDRPYAHPATFRQQFMDDFERECG